MEITTYNSLEEMQADMRENEQRANAAVLPWQTKIKVGDRFVVYEPDWELWAFCQVRADSEGVTDHERGYRFCDNFSVMCPEGEASDCHVLKALLPIDEDQWEEAAKKGWSVEAMLESTDDLAFRTALRLITVLKVVGPIHPYLAGKAL
jgi:hypothetical protein